MVIDREYYEKGSKIKFSIETDCNTEEELEVAIQTIGSKARSFQYEVNSEIKSILSQPVKKKGSKAEVARMRTVDQCVTYFKEHDPENQISRYYIGQLLAQKKIPCFQAGRRKLINLDLLIEFLYSDNMEEEEESLPKGYGTLRKVEV